MIGFVVVTHGNLAAELISTAEMIVGKIEGIKGVPILQSLSQEDAREEISSAIKSVDKGKGVLILTDLFGGTPSNLSISFLEEKKVEVVTGVSLPMLVKLSNVRGNLNLEDMAKLIRSYGRENISIAGELLKGRA
ncbi:MAG: PTS sugar transporter subunit IIA [Deltaproteobacteria bacterium]|nr:PTS sugar transporter subunit IIA [Deltaproteobacteria bacterium]